MRTLLAVFAVALAACTPVESVHFAPGGGCDAPNDGVLFLTWTVRGQAPTAQACGSLAIDHLELSTSGACGFGIEPIPCALDKFLYEQLPEGQTIATIVGVDAHGNVVVQGAAPVVLTRQQPQAPTPIDLE